MDLPYFSSEFKAMFDRTDCSLYVYCHYDYVSEFIPVTIVTIPLEQFTGKLMHFFQIGSLDLSLRKQL